MSEESTAEQHLESGWDLTTPSDDTIMLQIVHAVADDIISGARAAGGRHIRTDHFAASDLGEAGDYSNVAILLRPILLEDVDKVVHEINEFFDPARKRGFCGVFSVWPEPDLRVFGWMLGGHPPAHYLPPGLSKPPDPEGVIIRRASTLSDLYAIIDSSNAAFDSKADPLAVVTEHSLADPRRGYWIAEVDGMSAGGSASYLADELTYVSLVATRPEFQRRGIGTALTWRASLAQPGRPAVLISSDVGRPTYDRMGYLRLLRFTFWYRRRNGVDT